MSIELADPIYNFIQVDNDFYNRFFQNPGIQEQIFRAKNITCLGLVKYFIPSANHTKFEHHLGTYHLIRKSRKLLTRFDACHFNLLIHLNFFSCFGYLPLGYCTSEAVILAAQFEPSFRKKLFTAYLNPVLEAAKKHDDSFSVNLNFLVDSYQYKTLNSWFGAYKILNSIQGYDYNGLAIPELIHALIDNNHPAKKAYFDYATIDYLQRDLFYTGGGKFHIPINKIFVNSRKGILHPGYKLLIEALRSLLNNQVYSHPQHASLETWAKYQLAELLIADSIQIDDLLCRSDYFLIEKLNLKDAICRFTGSRTILKEEYFINKLEISKTDKIPWNKQEAYNLVFREKPALEDGFIFSAGVQNLGIAYNKFIIINYIIQHISRMNFSKLLGLFHAISDTFKFSSIEHGININSYVHAYAGKLLAFICQSEISIEFDWVFYYLQNYFRSNNTTFFEFQEQLTAWIGEIQKKEDKPHNIFTAHDINLKEYILNGKKLAFLLEYIIMGPVDKQIKEKIIQYLKKFIINVKQKNKDWINTKAIFLIYFYLLQTKVIQAEKTIICPRVKVFNGKDQSGEEIDFVLLDLIHKEIHFYITTSGKNNRQVQSEIQLVKNLTGKLATFFDSPAYTINFIGPEQYPYNFEGDHRILNMDEILRE